MQQQTPSEEPASFTRSDLVDGMYASLGAHAGGLVALAWLTVMHHDLRGLLRAPMVGAALVACVGTVLVGAILGVWLVPQSRSTRLTPWSLAVLGAPMGALLGLLEAMAHRPFVVMQPDYALFLAIGVGGGACVGGVSWALYVLRPNRRLDLFLLWNPVIAGLAVIWSILLVRV